MAPVVVLTVLAATSPALEAINTDRIETTRRGMWVLGTWGAANLAAGVTGWATTEGRTRAFHQMNAGWGAVNLGIAGLSLWLDTPDPAALGPRESLAAGHGLASILLLNVGLDVGYLAAGGLLWERGLRKSEPRLVGFGTSILVQGAFLLVFDVVLYLLVRAVNGRLLDEVVGGGGGLVWRFR